MAELAGALLEVRKERLLDHLSATAASAAGAAPAQQQEPSAEVTEVSAPGDGGSGRRGGSTVLIGAALVAGSAQGAPQVFLARSVSHGSRDPNVPARQSAWTGTGLSPAGNSRPVAATGCGHTHGSAELLLCGTGGRCRFRFTDGHWNAGLVVALHERGQQVRSALHVVRVVF